MIPYWILFLVPAWVALATSPQAAQEVERGRGSFVIFGILLALMIGFRYSVGGDWGFEHRAFWELSGLDLAQAIELRDPGFATLIWLFCDSGFNVWTVNTACGAIFAVGLLIFCRNEPHPWPAIAIAVPYLAIVVAMGYSRQSVAIGLAMIALVKLQQRSLLGFNVFMVLAATVHVTAVLLIPLGMVAAPIRRFWAIVLGGPVFLAAFVYLLQERVEYFVSGYIEAEYESQGALIRVAMNALPGALFLLLRRKFDLEPERRLLFMILSIAAVLLVPVLMLSPSSTAVDRMALYLIPLQMMVLGRLPLALARTTGGYLMVCGGVLAYMAAVLFVWLNFATHAQYWLPYQLFPIAKWEGVSP